MTIERHFGRRLGPQPFLPTKKIEPTRKLFSGYKLLKNSVGQEIKPGVYTHQNPALGGLAPRKFTIPIPPDNTVFTMQGSPYNVYMRKGADLYILTGAKREKIEKQYGIKLPVYNNADVDSVFGQQKYNTVNKFYGDYKKISPQEALQGWSPQSQAGLKPIKATTTITGAGAVTYKELPQNTTPSGVSGRAYINAAGQIVKPTSPEMEANFQKLGFKPVGGQGNPPVGVPQQDIAQGVAGIAQKTKQIGEAIATLTQAKQAGMEITPQTSVTAAEKYLQNPPSLPKTTGTQHVDALTSGIEADLQTKRQAVEKEYQDQLKTIQDSIAKTESQIESMTSAQKGIVTKDIQPLLSSFREAKQKAERERLEIEKNYFANQKTIDEMNTLLNQARAEIVAASAVTGLRAIREPRIHKLKEDMAARLGVLQAVIAARNRQIAMGETLINHTLSAIQADRQARLSYYNSLYKFYQTAKDEKGRMLLRLRTNERGYLLSQMEYLKQEMFKAQQSADYVKRLMANPRYANLLERAGVKLTDSVDEINQKLAQDAYTQEVIDLGNKMATKGYQEIPAAQLYNKPANEVVELRDSQGNPHYYWKEGGETTKTSTTAQKHYILQQTIDKMREYAGGDGYVSPDTYKALKTAWRQRGYNITVGDFDKLFSSTFVNPTHPQDYGVKTKTKTKTIPRIK